jgi:hypothetical protein
LVAVTLKVVLALTFTPSCVEEAPCVLATRFVTAELGFALQAHVVLASVFDVQVAVRLTGPAAEIVDGDACSEHPEGWPGAGACAALQVRVDVAPFQDQLAQAFEGSEIEKPAP